MTNVIFDFTTTRIESAVDLPCTWNQVRQLGLAASNDSLVAVQRLIKRGADAPNGEGSTSLILAAFWRNLEIVKHKTNPNLKNN